MSTKAKMGKDWVKCQLVLAETGETLHLTFAPGQTRKKVVAHIDGRTDVGWISLSGLDAAPPHDATLTLSLDGQGVRKAAAPATAPAKPKVAPPTPAAAAPKPAPAPVEAPKAPEPVAAPEQLPPPPEEIVVSEVQASTADTTTAAGGVRRGRPPKQSVAIPDSNDSGD